MWPFSRRATETRSSGAYTEAIIASIVASADGASTAKAGATAAVEAASGFVGRSFQAAAVAARPAVRELLTPAVMGLIGRSLIRDGELVFLIRADLGGVRLLPVQSYDVTGGPDPATWTYRVTVQGATRMMTVTDVPESGIVHFRYAFVPATPWRGLSPIGVASLAGKLSAETVAALADEAAGPRGAFLPIPVDGKDATIGTMKADIRSANGAILTVESGDWDSADAGKQTAWQSRRFGADPPAALVELHKRATQEVYAACGLNAAVFELGTGTGGREAYRQALFGVVAPLGRLVESELRAKLEDPTIALSWDELRAADIAGRARAFQSMVGAGMDAAKAAGLAGLMIADDAGV